MTDSLEYIDNYFQGKSLPEEKKLFEQRIAEDPAFAEEVAFYLSAQQIGKEHLAEAFFTSTTCRSIYTSKSSNTSCINGLRRRQATNRPAVI